jgi:fibronectin type 3 domain-containing protein
VALPAAPKNVGALASSGQVSLTWAASAGATSYNVLRSTVSGGPYVMVAGSVGATRYTDKGLTNGTTYYYVVQAVNASGTSPNSTQVSATPIAPPAAPANFVATAGSGQVTLAWSPSDGASSYIVRRSTVSGGPYVAIKSALVGTSYVDQGLADGTYYYVVQAANKGGVSSYSAEASATLGTTPNAPTGVSASGGNGYVNLTWIASAGATSYNVLRSTVSGGPYAPAGSGIASTSYTDLGLTDGTTYYYVVLAVNAGGTSPNSTQVSATPIAPPAAPTNVVVTAGSGQVTLTWAASETATSYIVRRSTVSGGPYVAIKSGLVATTYVDQGLTSGTTYYYVVQAANKGGVSPYSAQVSATP